MIGLVDCNNFFVSCERLFRPDLLKKPVAVLSSNDGCIVARSQEVKDLGIGMGVPYFEVKDICEKNDIALFSTNLTLYRDISARVMSAVKAECELFEVYSIDEAFFEVKDDITEAEIAEMRARIIQKTGIPVSIGIATTKTRAKVANGIAKKGTGVCIMSEPLWDEVKMSTKCGSIWGIGRQTSLFLSKQNINTVSEFLSLDKAFVKQSLGIVGERLYMELLGVSVYGVGENADDDQQSYTSTRSFEKPIMDKLVMRSALGYHVAHLAEKLRRDGCVASRISIIARGSRFGVYAHRNGTASTTLAIPTNDTITLTQEVSRLFDTIFDPEIPYKKAGVLLSMIEKNEYTSKSLFESEEVGLKRGALSALFDSLNQKFGAGTLATGVVLSSNKWRHKRKLLSQEYTTKWSEIASVKAT